MAPRTGSQPYETTEPSSDTNTDRSRNNTQTTSTTATLHSTDQMTTTATETAIEELLRRVKGRDPSDLDWKGKVRATYKTFRDVEFMFHVYTEERNEPKVEALMAMLDTIVMCLVGGGNVHTFMDDPEWVRAHSSVSTTEKTQWDFADA